MHRVGWSISAVQTGELIPGLSHQSVAGEGAESPEGRVIVLVFLGVCALIALHQLLPALRRFFKVTVEGTGRKEETGSAPGDQG